MNCWIYSTLLGTLRRLQVYGTRVCVRYHPMLATSFLVALNLNTMRYVKVYPVEESPDDGQVYSDIIGKTPSSNETAVTDAYMRMVESLPQLFTADHRPKVVVAIDDAHTLNRMDGFQPSTILCSVISTYSRFKSPWNHSTWVVFASTTLKIADFAARHDRCAFSPSVLTIHPVLICPDRRIFANFREWRTTVRAIHPPWLGPERTPS